MIKTEKNIRSGYKEYFKSVSNPVSEKEYVTICSEYNKYLMKKVFEGDEITLPARMGILFIVGKKNIIKFNDKGEPNLPVNWKATTDLWKRDIVAAENKKKIYHTNDHTDGVTYRFFWSKKNIFAENKNLYSLIFTRDNKRMVNTMILKGQEYFIKPY